MFDPNAPSSRRAIEELRNEPVRRSLLKYAIWRTSSEADADDLIAKAIECACDPDRKPWDPSRASFSRHMRLVMDHVAIALARTGYAKFERPNSDLVYESAARPGPAAELALDDQREVGRLRRLATLLIDRLEGKDPLAVLVFRAASEGIEEPAAQALKIGCEPKDVYEAWRRLRYHGARMAADEELVEAPTPHKMRKGRDAAVKETTK